MSSVRVNRWWRRGAAGVACLALVLTACGGGDDGGGEQAAPEAAEPAATDDATDDDASRTESTAEGDEEWNALVAAAEEEGRVVLYGQSSPDIFDAVGEAFEEAYPAIDFDYFRSSTSEMEEKMAGERSAGSPQADVALTANRFWAIAQNEEGLAEDIMLSPDNESFVEQCLTDDGRIAATGINLIGMAYNPEDVQDPQSLQDFVGTPGGWVDPEVTVLAVFAYDTFGWDTMQAFADSGERVAIHATGPEGVNAVAAGEQTWAFTASSQVPVIREQGANIEFFAPDPAPAFDVAGIVPTDAPHPAAAQVLMDFLFSVEAQGVLNGNGAAVSCRDDVPGTLEAPEEMVMFSQEHVDPEFVTEGQERFSELYR